MGIVQINVLLLISGIIMLNIGFDIRKRWLIFLAIIFLVISIGFFGIWFIYTISMIPIDFH
ncbi:hypothetical protein [Cytobacillus sp. IB215665]|uniref:hypothetical protein n=1 Tax=Cytobacillus sp. IB215665 TaxID=3097357 RepID=UPI002A1755A5|nr:hypothetical protein [Cytobacillus sp. IB215665]MDX8365702.1 hypothetical protein [Cytobacillus sp. IB215665]